MKRLVVPTLGFLLGFGSLAFATTGSTGLQFQENAVLKCAEPPAGQQSCPVRIYFPGQPPTSLTLAVGEVIAVGSNAVLTCSGCVRA